MERLRKLPAETVYPGHDTILDRDRLQVLALAYLEQVGAVVANQSGAS